MYEILQTSPSPALNMDLEEISNLNKIKVYEFHLKTTVNIYIKLSQPNSTSTHFGSDKVIGWPTIPDQATHPTHLASPPIPQKLLRHFQET